MTYSVWPTICSVRATEKRRDVSEKALVSFSNNLRFWFLPRIGGKIGFPRRIPKETEESSPAAVRRPWGIFMVLHEGPEFKVKRILLKPGAALSLQLHRHRSEHWVVVAGIAHVINGELKCLRESANRPTCLKILFIG
jgi:hypothetical protein